MYLGHSDPYDRYDWLQNESLGDAKHPNCKVHSRQQPESTSNDENGPVDLAKRLPPFPVAEVSAHAEAIGDKINAVEGGLDKDCNKLSEVSFHVDLPECWGCKSAGIQDNFICLFAQDSRGETRFEKDPALISITERRNVNTSGDS